MSVRVGISPIAWQNDDLPELTAAFTMEQALREAREIGYVGVERGQRMPSDTEALREMLETAGLALCGGWCSGNLLATDVAREREAIEGQVAQFAALGAPCIVYAECSNTIQGRRDAPMSTRPKLEPGDFANYGARLGELAKWTADSGMPLAYHHHVGTIVESGEDLDRLMDATPPEVGLCYDSGHLRAGGGDELQALDRWGDRVAHVHFKDVRPDVAGDMRARDESFLDGVIAGMFAVPGDGTIDFQAIANRLAGIGYSGWIVVEAEQDPASAPPYEHSKNGYEHVLRVCAEAGLEVQNEA